MAGVLHFYLPRGEFKAGLQQLDGSVKKVLVGAFKSLSLLHPGGRPHDG